MNLIVLGSGPTSPHPTRSSSGYWLETGAGSILLDCSAPVAMRMAHERLNWPNLGAIWISHFHMDHCGGLGPLLIGMRHAQEVQDRSEPLRIFGGKGLKGLIDRLIAVNDYGLLKQPFPVEIVEIEDLEKWEILPGIEAVAMKTPHTPESHAIHFRDPDDTTFVYTADTGFDENIAAFGRGVDLFVLESTFVRDKTVEKHLELAEAMHLVRKAKPKRAMLTHFYPQWDDVDFNEEIAKFDPPCEVIEARDGLRLTFGVNKTEK